MVVKTMSIKKKEIKNTKKEIGNITYTNKNIGFSITIPDTWMEVKKSSYEELGISSNTLFIFVVNKFTSMTALFSGFTKEKSFNKFFEQLNFDDNNQFKILSQTTTDINKMKVHQLVIETKNNKLVHNFCLINDMIINFIINIDPKNKVFDKKGIINDLNFKQINDVLSTIKIFEPTNPPVYVDDTKSTTINITSDSIHKLEENQNIDKTLAQILVETECKYKNILVPELYMRYTYEQNGANVSLNIINNEIYLKRSNGSFKIIKVNEDVVNEIERIIHIHISHLTKISSDIKNNSKSVLLIKIENKYAYIDLNNSKHDMSKLKNMVNAILKQIKNNNDKTLDIEDFLIKEDKNNIIDNCKEKDNDLFIEFLSEYENKLTKKKKETLFKEFLYQYDSKLSESNKINKENETFRQFLVEYDLKMQESLKQEDEEIKNEIDEEFSTLLELVKEYTNAEMKKEKEIEDSIFREFLTQYEAKLNKTKKDKLFKDFLAQYEKKLIKKKKEDLFTRFLTQYDVKLNKTKKDKLFKEFLYSYDNKLNKKNQNELFQEFLTKYETKLNKTKKDKLFKDFIIKYEERLKKSKEDELFRKFLDHYESKINEEKTEEIKKQKEDKEVIEPFEVYMMPDKNSSTEIIKGEAKIKDNEPFEVYLMPNVIMNNAIDEETLNEQEDTNNESINDYNIEEFQEYFHNVDGHASFRFLFPYNSGEKIIRDFNVFDIVNYNQLMYRIFIFKCENEEKYQIKLRDWMDKNIQSNKTILKDSYTKTSKKGLEINTYVLETSKFYKVAYIYGYLIAISGFIDEKTDIFADIALENVEIGEDSRAFVEAHDRKMRSINILEAQGIPYIDELPVIKSSYEITGKTLDDIAKRAIVLCICCNFASDLVSNKKKKYIKESKKFFTKLLDSFNVKDVMTKDEKLLFDKMDKKLAVQIAWQFEGYVILLWTLGLIDEILFPDELIEPDSVTAIVSACDSYREFVEKCQLRSVHEVLDLADLTYRYNWYCVESKINDEEPVMNPEIVMERHRALNWLLTNEKWDKVEINT